MKISDLFRQLSYGELSNLAISGSGAGTIIEAKKPQLIHYTNDALVALFTRFVLIEKEVLIEQIENVTLYNLLAKHSESVGTETHKYILDTPEAPFEDDRVIRINEVWGTLSGDAEREIRFPLNDAEARFSLFTPAPLVLQVPEPVDGEALSVLYQAYHPPLLDAVPEDDEDFILLDQIIDIPHYLDNALQQLIASKVFSHMNGQENVMKGQEYLVEYEKACLNVEQRDLAAQTWHTSHTKLEQRGFV